MGVLALPWRVARRFFQEGGLQTAAGLSFATLLGLVPMLALAAAVLARLPLMDAVAAAIREFLLANLLPEKAGTVIARYLGQFAGKAGQMTVAGLAGLAFTALVQMFTIESAFNDIWRVKDTRSFLWRTIRHLLALLLGPLLFGGTLALLSLVAGVSFGWLDEPQWLNEIFFRGLPMVAMAGLFALLYRALPNQAVLWRHALAGGVVAMLGFMGLQKLFALYVASLKSYTVIYGAFSAIPIFLVWLHFSWSVILVGGLTVAELGRKFRT